MTDEVSRAVEIAQIVNVLLDGSTAQYAHPIETHGPVDLEGMPIQTRKEVKGHWIICAPHDENLNLLCIRFEFGIRIMLRDAPQTTDSKPEEREYGRIEATFVGQYLLTGPPPADEKTVEEFSRTIGMLNIWPYWREHAHDLARRMGWRGVIVPLFKLRFQENNAENIEVVAKFTK